MLRLFNDNKPYVLFVLPFLLAGFYTYHFMVEGSGLSHPISMGLWGRLSLSEAVLPWWIGLGFLVHLVLIITLNFIFNEANFYERNNYLPSLLSMTLMVSTQGYFGFNALHLAFLGLLLCCHQMLKLDQNIRAEKYLFNAAFFYSLSVSFFPALIFGIPILYVLSFIFRPFSLREFSRIHCFFIRPLGCFHLCSCLSSLFSIRRVLARCEIYTTALRGKCFFVSSLDPLVIHSGRNPLRIIGKMEQLQQSSEKRTSIAPRNVMLIGISACLAVNIPFTLGLLALPMSMLFTLAFLDKRIRRGSSFLFYGLLVLIIVKILLKT
ncbi:MAG: hypothetical protein RLZZ68_1192 [Bacteroidota bacterium]